jgi:hypothetical protein
MMNMQNSVLDKLTTNGGFTLDLRTPEGWVTKGFAVSVNPERTQTSQNPDASTLARYVLDNWDLLSQEPKVFGGWLDTESGITYLDVVTVFDSKEEALDLAVQHGELAIFDLGSGQEIRTGLVKV